MIYPQNTDLDKSGERAKENLEAMNAIESEMKCYMVL